ncbi:MAG: ATP-binding protein [Actinomycetota bacterium]
MAAERRRALFWHLRARSGTVRVRTTAGAVLVVGVALLVAAIAMVVLLRRSLTDDVRTAAMIRADAVLDVLEAGPGLDGVRVGDQEDEFVQVLDRGGRVIASSANLEGEPPIAVLEPGESAQLERVPFEDDPSEDEPFLAVAASGSASAGTITVVVGRTLESVVESSQVVGTLLVFGLPLLLLVVGAVTWRVAGRALAPVESIRAEVESISTEELHRRVPAPSSGDEIGRLALTMNQMLERLERGQARQRRFVSDASHELRSPVTSIRQHAEVALAHPEGVSAPELARVVLDEDLRLQRLVEDLLLLARMDEHTADRRKEVLDLDDVVFQEVDRIRQTTPLSIDTSRVSAGRVLGDRPQLTRLTGNLLDNAVRHARASVAVALSEEAGEVVFRVDDDGSGVPPESRGRIFERFTRLQEARDRDSGGSGLGLAIVAEVADAHGGSARALDSPLGGARFEVRFPRRFE